MNMAVERSVFQSFASMALPAAAIHTQVRTSFFPIISARIPHRHT